MLVLILMLDTAIMIQSPSSRSLHMTSETKHFMAIGERTIRTMRPLNEDERRHRRDGTSATHSDEVGRKVARSRALKTAEHQSG